jgi:hypothetical protein
VAPSSLPEAKPDAFKNPKEGISEVKKTNNVVRVMKYLSLLILAAMLAACDTSEEDRNFYYNGWLKPETDSNKRMYGEDPLQMPN